MNVGELARQFAYGSRRCQQCGAVLLAPVSLCDTCGNELHRDVFELKGGAIPAALEGDAWQRFAELLEDPDQRPYLWDLS